MLLRRCGHSFTTSAEMDAVRQIKESVCFVVFNPSELEHKSATKSNYSLPDGTVIEV
jgi:centractin